MPNLKALAGKLQMALAMKGRYIKVNQFQSWSVNKQRMVTKYMLCEKRMIDEKEKNVPILESYQAADVVVALAALLKETGGDDQC